MRDLMTLSQFVNWLNSMTSTGLNHEFPNIFHKLENVASKNAVDLANVILANDAIMLRLIFEYNKFLQKKLTIDMFEGDNKIFEGGQYNDYQPSTVWNDYKIAGKMIFQDSNGHKNIPFGFMVYDISGLGIKTVKPIFNNSGYIKLIN